MVNNIKPFVARGNAIKIKRRLIGRFDAFFDEPSRTEGQIRDAFYAVLGRKFCFDMDYFARRGLPLSGKKVVRFVSNSLVYARTYDVYVDDDMARRDL